MIFKIGRYDGDMIGVGFWWFQLTTDTTIQNTKIFKNILDLYDLCHTLARFQEALKFTEDEYT